MAIKVEIIEKQKQKTEFNYPFIGKSNLGNGMIVLFHAKDSGIVLELGANLSLENGKHYTGFDMNTFDKLEGEIIISNE